MEVNRQAQKMQRLEEKSRLWQERVKRNQQKKKLRRVHIQGDMPSTLTDTEIEQPSPHRRAGDDL
jgi:hypothetical protein